MIPRGPELDAELRGDEVTACSRCGGEVRRSPSGVTSGVHAEWCLQITSLTDSVCELSFLLEDLRRRLARIEETVAYR